MKWSKLLDIYPRGVYDDFIKSHYENTKEESQKRLNIIRGQLEGLSKMIQNDSYCIDLLTQSLAIQNSLKSLDTLLFERHLSTHVVHQYHNEPTKATEELVTLFKRIKK